MSRPVIKNLSYDCVFGQGGHLNLLAKQKKVEFSDLDSSATMDLFEGNDGKVSLTKFLSSSSCVLGTTGSGKSVTVARLIEQLCFNAIPLSVFDREGDFTTVQVINKNVVNIFFEEDLINDNITFKKEYYSNGEKLYEYGIIKKVYVEVKKKDDPVFVGLDETIEQIAEYNFSHSQQTILNISELSDQASKAFVLQYANMVVTLSNRLFSKHGMQLHHLLLLDEAHQFIPSMHGDFWIKGDRFLGKLKKVFSQIAAMGRKKGLSLIIASQRPSNLTTDLKANINQYFLHFVSSILDKKAYCNYIAMDYHFKKLEKLSSPGCIFHVFWRAERFVKMKFRDSPHKSSTPKPSDTRKTQEWLKDKNYVID